MPMYNYLEGKALFSIDYLPVGPGAGSRVEVGERAKCIDEYKMYVLCGRYKTKTKQEHQKRMASSSKYAAITGDKGVKPVSYLYKIKKSPSL